MDPNTPDRCPTCGTDVPEGATRCPGCGRVFGESNRCPHCHAIAAVIARRGITVCAACGKPRAGAVVLGGGRGSIVPASHVGRTASTSAMLRRGRGRVQRGVGVVMLAAAVLLAALAAAVLPGTAGLLVALVVAAIGVGLGAVSLRAGSRSLREGGDDDRRARETAVLELAQERGGRLTASDVAKAFRITLDEADALLTGMVGDGSRVGVDVDDEGVLRYVFRELTAAPSARMRVEVEADELEEEGSPPSSAERARTER